MGLGTDGGEKIQAMPMGVGFGLDAGVYTVKGSDRVFQSTAAGTVIVTLADEVVVSGPVGAYIGHTIVRGTVSIECDVPFNIG